MLRVRHVYGYSQVSSLQVKTAVPNLFLGRAFFACLRLALARPVRVVWEGSVWWGGVEQRWAGTARHGWGTQHLCQLGGLRAVEHVREELTMTPCAQSPRLVKLGTAAAAL